MPSPPNQYLTFYRHLGLDNLQLVKGQFVRPCFFCGQEDTFAISPDTGQYNCYRCGSGNIYSFMQALLDESIRLTTDDDYHQLSKNRGIAVETFRIANLAKSSLNGNWLIPSYSHESKLVNLYQAIAYEKIIKVPRSPPRKTIGYEIRSAASPCTQQLYGIDQLRQQPVIIIVEGHWDRLALWEIFAHLIPNAPGCFTWNPIVRGLPDYFGGIFNEVCILGVPGANIFKPEWAPLLRDKIVVLIYDNDKDRVICPVCRGKEGYRAHPSIEPCPMCGGSKTTGQILNPGREGKERVIKELDELGIQAHSLLAVNWKINDPKDVRDVLCLN